MRTPRLGAPGMWYLFIPGVPLLFFVLLYSKRRAIMERTLRDGSSEIEVYSVCQAFHDMSQSHTRIPSPSPLPPPTTHHPTPPRPQFLFAQYLPEFWYFVVIDSFRRVTFTCLLLYLDVFGQIVVALTLALSFVIFYRETNPYWDSRTDTLNYVLAWVILFCVIALHFQDLGLIGFKMFNGSEAILSGFLIFVNVAILVLATWARPGGKDHMSGHSMSSSERAKAETRAKARKSLLRPHPPKIAPSDRSEQEAGAEGGGGGDDDAASATERNLEREAEEGAEAPGRSSSTVAKEAAMWKQPWTDGVPSPSRPTGDSASGGTVSKPGLRSPARLPPLPAQPKAPMVTPGSASKKRSAQPSAKTVAGALTTLSHGAHVAHAAAEAKAEPKQEAAGGAKAASARATHHHHHHAHPTSAKAAR